MCQEDGCAGQTWATESWPDCSGQWGEEHRHVPVPAGLMPTRRSEGDLEGMSGEGPGPWTAAVW